MNTRNPINWLTACVLLLAASASNAAYIDSNTGLEWLDLGETQYDSYNTVITRITVGDLAGEGWRYATGDEFDTMVTGFGTGGTPGGHLPCLGQAYCGWSTANNGLVTQLLSTFGDLTGMTRSYGILADSIGLSHRASQFYDWAGSAESVTQDLIMTYDTAVSGNQGQQNLGSFLVREVPVPAAAWLFLSALGGLGIIKRKRQ